MCTAGTGTVSAKPIVLRVEFAYAPNLTIIDTPGFILKVRQIEPLEFARSSPVYAALDPPFDAVGSDGAVSTGEAGRGRQHSQ